jgi:CubicO group peptidase (beta-lactamase class C family)
MFGALFPPHTLTAPRSTSTIAKKPGDELEGVWEARNMAGPLLRGRLSLWAEGSKITAEIGGISTHGILLESNLKLEFPNKLGSLRAELTSDGNFRGFWIQPSGTFLFGAYATPVELIKQSKGAWSGAVNPLDDVATLYLVVKKTAEGKFATFLRNPERNEGVHWNLKELVEDANGVRILGQNQLGPNNVVTTEPARGNYDKESDTLSLYFPYRTSSFAFKRVSANSYSGFYPRPVGVRTYHYQPPFERADGWNVASAQAEGMSVPGVDKFVQSIIDRPDDSVHALNTHAVLIARHGKIVLEEYFHGFGPDVSHDLRSAAKSFTSVLAGIAIHESKILNLNTPIVDVLKQRSPIDEKDPRKSKITLENLLTMSAGLDCDDDSETSPGNEDTMQGQEKDPDWYHYAMNVPMAFDPGSKAVYGSALPNLVGGVIATDRKVWLPDYFRDKIANPLGIKDYGLPITPTGDAYMGGGVRLKPRDFLKLGQMMLDGGIWNGKRILDATYAHQAIQPRYQLAGIQYGFFWWVTDYAYQGRTVRAYFAGGNGGQVVEVIPDLSLVFCCNAGNYSDVGTYVPQREWIPKYVLPMIEASGK